MTVKASSYFAWLVLQADSGKRANLDEDVLEWLEDKREQKEKLMIRITVHVCRCSSVGTYSC